MFNAIDKNKQILASSLMRFEFTEFGEIRKGLLILKR